MFTSSGYSVYVLPLVLTSSQHELCIPAKVFQVSSSLVFSPVLFLPQWFLEEHAAVNHSNQATKFFFLSFFLLFFIQLRSLCQTLSENPPAVNL